MSESQAKLQVTAGGDLAKWKLGWKWKNGAGAVTIADLGDPLSTTSYTLCVYDETAGVPALKLQAVVDAAGTCGADPCWKALGSSGFSYKNTSGNAAGISKLSLKSGGPAKAKIQIKGAKAALPLPTAVSGTEFFDQDVNVTVQIRASDTGACWTSSFTIPKKNTAAQYKAKTP